MAKFALPGWLRTAGFAALALFLLYFAFQGVDLNAVWESAQEAKWGYIGLSVALGYIAILSRGQRWTYVLKYLGYPTTLWRAVHATGVGYLVNLAIPRAGEVARATALNRADKTPVNVLIGTILIERTIDLLMMAGLLGLAFLSASEELSSLIALTQSETDPQAGPGIPWFKLFLGLLSIGALIAWLCRARIQASPFYAKVRDFLKGMLEGIKAVGQLPNKWAFWAHTFFIWGCYYAMVYVC